MFDRYFFQLRHAHPFKLSFFLKKTKFFHEITFRSSIDVELQFDANLASFCFPKSTQNPWKCRPQEAPNNASIFASFLGPKKNPSWDPTWTHLGPQFRIKTAQEASQTPPKRPPRPNLEPAWFSKSPQDGPGGLPAPPLVPVGLEFARIGVDFEGFWAPIFFTLLKFVDFIFSITLALCWSTFFTRIWCWMGCWGYAKSQAFILFDLIRFEFYSLRRARILEPKTTTKFWSSRGLQKFVDVWGSRVIDFTWLNSLWISLTSILKHFLH